MGEKMEVEGPPPDAFSAKALVDKTVVPGDVVLDLSKMTNQTIKLGSGLRQDGDTITVIKAGKLRFSKPTKYWVESSQKRYIPCVEDTVLGIVADCKPDNFLVDIKGPTLAYLPVLAFEGGTRRNIPKFEIGTLLYVRVIKANSGMNPELSCTDGYFFNPRHQYSDSPHNDGEVLQGTINVIGRLSRSMDERIDAMIEMDRFKLKLDIYRDYDVKEAVTRMGPASGKAAEFGPLKDGYMFESSTGLCRMLLGSPTCPVLEALGKKLSFETAIGLNGRVWVNASSPKTIIAVANAIMNSESLSAVQQRIMVEKLMQSPVMLS